MTDVRRYGAVIIGISVVVLAAMTGFQAGARRAAPSSRTDSTVASLVSAVIRAEGQIVTTPGAKIDVSSEIGGRVVLLSVHAQQEVHRGQVIAEIGADEARAALAEAQAQIVEADANTTWLTAEQQRTITLIQTGSVSRQVLDRTTHDLAAARARRTVAEATVRRLSATLAKTRVIAPIDGTIVSRAVELGEVIAPGTRLVTIADLRRRRVEAEVDEYDAGRVHPGVSVAITAEGYGTQTWHGTVETIPNMVVPRELKPEDPGRPSDTQVLRVEVTLPQDAPFKLGQRVELAIHTR